MLQSIGYYPHYLPIIHHLFLTQLPQAALDPRRDAIERTHGCVQWRPILDQPTEITSIKQLKALTEKRNALKLPVRHSPMYGFEAMDSKRGGASHANQVVFSIVDPAAHLVRPSDAAELHQTGVLYRHMPLPEGDAFRDSTGLPFLIMGGYTKYDLNPLGTAGVGTSHSLTHPCAASSASASHYYTNSGTYGPTLKYARYRQPSNEEPDQRVQNHIVHAHREVFASGCCVVCLFSVWLFHFALSVAF